MTIEVFFCRPLSTKLTRASCAARSERARSEAAGRGRKGQGHLVANECVECPLGAAHRAGQAPVVWPDGAALALHELAVPAPGSQPLTGRTALPPKPAPAPDPLKETAVDEDCDAPAPATTEGSMGTKVGERLDCARCGESFVKTHPRHRYCKPCRPLAAKETKRRSAKRKGAASPPTKRAAQRKAGDRLNELFERGTASRAEPLSHGAVLDTVVEAVAELERRAASGREAANKLAELWALPMPFPTED